MADCRYDVLGIGHGMVDLYFQCEEKVIADLGLAKGTRVGLSADQAERLYQYLVTFTRTLQTRESPGGSAASTIAGVASLGGKAAFIGAVGDEHLGEVFSSDLQQRGVAFNTAPIPGALTGRSTVLVSPDAQRTMATFPGTAQLKPEDITSDLIEASAVTYLEAYLLEEAEASYLKAVRLAHYTGSKLALGLSDVSCVETHRDQLSTVIRDARVDLLFANELEIMRLFDAGNLEKAAERLGRMCPQTIGVLTRGEKGALIVCGTDVFVIAAERAAAVDTTGAGDLFAAGFLFGFARRKDLAVCGKVASICAAAIVSQLGSRPRRPLADLIDTVA